MKQPSFVKVGIFLMLALSVSVMAFAYDGHRRIYSPAYGSSTFDIGYQRGYDDGVRHGEADRYSGVNYNYSHSREYKKADRGYDRSFGSKDAYKNSYRSGYAAGYDNGYYRNGYSRRERDSYYRRDRYGRYDRYDERGSRRSVYGSSYDEGYSAGYNQAVRDFNAGRQYRLSDRDNSWIRPFYRSGYGDYPTFERGFCDGYRTYYRR